MRATSAKWLVTAASFGAALVLASCGGRSGPQIVGVWTSPWPGGPGGILATTKPVQGDLSLRVIDDAIPGTLPPNPEQECREGAIVTITFDDGATRSYGPCRRPASVERLRLRLLRAGERLHPPPPNDRPVGDREWKNLINDWYDGHIDGWYRCAVVRRAIQHLPPSPPTYSTVRLDFHSYARAVCPPVQ